ncbi:GNAT family N-acetyltransferase [Thalassotalea profundi]|uniref:N-acetyltransferase GCN5 n=1 Tax=Thalassotalea profundi TaxID=2036687 RepID=A0ABQ3IV74_9GAMM|nr:GNAT family N-acetyltransferase [Thalassotalea profundi]GHE95683.1 N-acetyltransferase GCN5 [Thalassotalea profundi]
MMMIVCQTPRLVIRRFSHQDAEFIVKLLNEPSFIENITDKGVRSVADAIEYLNAGPIMSYKTHGFGLYAVELIENNMLIGMCGLLKRPELTLPDIGYAYLPAFWRKGYAKEAVNAVLEYAQQQLKIDKIAAVTSLNNISSIGLLESIGFKQLKTMQLYENEPKCRYFELLSKI